MVRERQPIYSEGESTVLRLVVSAVNALAQGEQTVSITDLATRFKRVVKEASCQPENGLEVEVRFKTLFPKGKIVLESGHQLDIETRWYSEAMFGTRLSPSETKFLAVLMANAGEKITYLDMQKALGYRGDIEDDIILLRQLVLQTRRSIRDTRDESGKFRKIVTVQGEGCFWRVWGL